MIRQSNRTRQKTKRGDRKWESNDRPEIPDRGMKSNIPSISLGGVEVGVGWGERVEKWKCFSEHISHCTCVYNPSCTVTDNGFMWETNCDIDC